MTTLKRLARLVIELVPTIAIVAVAGLPAERSLQLAAAPTGRIVLHVLCAWRDHRFAWHWRGVAREFALT